MTSPLLVLVSLLTLSACSIQPPQSLEQQLADPSLSKETILRRACLKEAEWSHSTHYQAATSSIFKTFNYNEKLEPEVKDMNQLCWKMINKEGSLEALHKECLQKIAVMRQNPTPGYAAHADRTLNICNHMTGTLK
jgi:hypothetical protein